MHLLDRTEIQRLAVAVADGERAAIEPLFRVLWAPLVRYATRFLGDEALAEDCVQDAMTTLFGQIDQLDRERDALAWAFTHVTWAARTARRKRERRNEVGDLLPESSAVPGYEDHDLVRSALAELEQLPARDREVIVAAIADDEQLRARLAPATFRKRLERALARLRTSWRSRHGTL
jgi:RNA polymerase sigma factor (sigma-70 family)